MSFDVSRFFCSCVSARVAQWIERVPTKNRVVGSNPTPSATLWEWWNPINLKGKETPKGLLSSYYINIIAGLLKVSKIYSLSGFILFHWESAARQSMKASQLNRQSVNPTISRYIINIISIATSYSNRLYCAAVCLRGLSHILRGGDYLCSQDVWHHPPSLLCRNLVRR